MLLLLLYVLLTLMLLLTLDNFVLEVLMLLYFFLIFVEKGLFIPFNVNYAMMLMPYKGIFNNPRA